MLAYATKLDKRDISLEYQTSDDLSSCHALDPLPKGWALKSSTLQRKRFSENQKLYLSKLFDVGEQTGRKVDANNVSKVMRKARNIFPPCKKEESGSSWRIKRRGRGIRSATRRGRH